MSGPSVSARVGIPAQASQHNDISGGNNTGTGIYIPQHNDAGFCLQDLSPAQGTPVELSRRLFLVPFSPEFFQSLAVNTVFLFILSDDAGYIQMGIYPYGLYQAVLFLKGQLPALKRNRHRGIREKFF